MTIAHAYTLLLEAAVLAASFGMLWLAFWVRDGRRRHGRPPHHPASDSPSTRQDSANAGALVLPTVASGIRLAIDLASSDVQPAGEKDEAVLYCPENAQYLNDEQQIQAEQNQRAQLKPMKSGPVVHNLPLCAAAFTLNPDGLVR